MVSGHAVGGWFGGLKESGGSK
ncbi:hypothetical protein CEXT_123681, partial [Caerostris extrusa]